MKSLTAKQTIKILEKHGFILSRQKGSHKIYRHSESKVIVPVSIHGGNKPIPIGTFLAIIKQSKIPKKEFKKK
ncbi:type II toxin-antitoxin system HicA family toxin [Patescibacteria group bacterium]|nr:type II toxin-antitoxin system HicA family toxin [Patescibacteria group bacterium]MBU2472682.1 type II toxin-antitoxin system HicA family toxin [Patescibacteria group bacterium]